MERGSFEKTLVVPSTDCDAGGVLTPKATLKYMQDVAGAGVDAVGLTHDVLLARGLVFMVAAHIVRFSRPIRVGEQITVRTDPALARGAHMARQTLFSDCCGKAIAEGQSDWILADPVTGHPHRSTELSSELDTLDKWEPFCDPTRLKIPVATTPCRTYCVTAADTDINHHMNNTVYAHLMMLCLDEGEQVGEFAIRYRSQVFPGDVLTLCRDGDTVCGMRGEEICFTGYCKQF